MFAEKSSKFAQQMIGLLLVTLLLGFNAAPAQPIYVDAGGPYEADVGDEIEFDASASFIADDTPIQVYYWDWNGDGQREGVSEPTVKHTWHSAFDGEVELYIFYEGGLGVGKARVTVNGPDTELVVTMLNGNANLGLRGPRGGHVGLNPDTGIYEIELPGSLFRFVPIDNPAFDPSDPDSPKTISVPQIRTPLLNEGPYDVEVAGLGDSAFELLVQGFVDGVITTEKVVAGNVVTDEDVTVEVGASYGDGALTLDVGQPQYCPELEADPDDIEIKVLMAGSTHTKDITLKETDGVHWATGVTLLCSDLTNDFETISGADISFSDNDFDIAPDGEMTVSMSVPVPDDFSGPVTGTVSVRCDADVSLDIPVTVRRAGSHAPIVEAGGPYVGVVGSPVTFDASGSYDPDGEIEDYCWDWDLDGESECTEDVTIEHTWEGPFNGLVQLRVVDNDGRESTQYVAVTILAAE